MNSSGLGARVGAFGSTSVAQNTLHLDADQLPANALAVLFMGTAAAASTFQGDGNLCLGGELRRIGKQITSSAGVARFGPGLLQFAPSAPNFGLWSAGDTRTFQVFYRNPSGPCGSGVNLSNAVQLAMTP
jgi:hypothetical protein